MIFKYVKQKEFPGLNIYDPKNSSELLAALIYMEKENKLVFDTMDKEFVEFLISEGYEHYENSFSYSKIIDSVDNTEKLFEEIAKEILLWKYGNN